MDFDIDFNDLDEKSKRDVKVLIYVYGILNNLKEKGFIDGGIFKLTTKGYEMYDKLVEEKFTPTEKEITEAMNAISDSESAYMVNNLIKNENINLN